METDYDVIIVGAGVAGCQVAERINGSVLVLEREKKIKLKDSGIVSREMLDLINVKHLVREKITEMEAVSPSGKTFSLSSDTPYAYILERNEFAKFLRNKARKKATIKYETVNGIAILHDHVFVSTNKSDYRAKMIIGADGASSIVRRSMKIKDPKISVGTMLKVRKRSKDVIRVYVNKYFSPDYFSWHIPSSGEYGSISSVRPMSYFDYFLKEVGAPKGKIFAYTIPLGMTRSYYERSLLVGDACGQNKPITGGGIVFSTMCAPIAASHINTAIERDDFASSSLRFYESEWKLKMANEIKKQLLFRKMYRKFTNNDIEKFFQDFGPSIQKMDIFDYDKLSTLAKGIPKAKLARLVSSNITKLIGKH